MLDAGAYIDYTDAKGFTPLYWAVLRNDVEMVRLLIKYGADLDIKSKNAGVTALRAALRNENIEIVELLVDSGANVDIPDRDGVTPLHRAVELANINIIELLLEAGANPDVVDKFGRRPLDLTKNQYIEEIFESYLYNIKEPDF